MKSFFKKLAFVMAMAMVISMAAPAAQRAAAATEFYYAKQNTTEKVPTLSMEVGDEVDLCFIGVKNYMSYTRKWVSSNEAVATVDKNGVVTAVADGVTTVELQVGDGTDYVSTPVVVTVGEVASVVLGTSKEDTFAEKTLKKGETIDLNFYGVKGWSAAKFSTYWVSTDTTVVAVDKMGIVEAKEAGTATVTIVIQNKETGALLTVTPVEFTVEDDAVKESFTAHQTSHITFDVDFNKEVSYGRDNVYLYRVFDTDKGDVYAVWAVRKASLNADKTTLTVEPYVQFGDAERYLVAFEDIETQLDEGTGLNGVNCYEFTTYIGEVDTIKVAWSTTVNGQTVDGVAYTNGEDADSDLDVKLDYRLYSGDVDLTEIYKDSNGYIEYVLVNENDVSDFVSLSEDILVFTKANIPAVVQVKYTYEDEEGNPKTTESDRTLIQSKLLEPFAISRVVEWSLDKGDWNWDKPVHSLRAGDSAEIMLLLQDNRGVRWETHVNKGGDSVLLFGADDSDTAQMSLKFYSTDNDHFLVGESDTDLNVGSLETYLQMRKAVIYVALHDAALLDEKDDDFVRNIGALVLDINAPAKFNSVAVYAKNDNGTLKDMITGTTLVTNAVVDVANPGRFVREFTTGEYYVGPRDQDGSSYDPTNDTELGKTTIRYTLTTTNKTINADIAQTSDGVGVDGLWLNSETGVLSVDANALKSAEYKTNSITANITATQYDKGGEEITSKKVSFKVSLKDPDLYKDTDVIPGEWAVGDVKPSIGTTKVSVSNVGLMPANGKSTAEIKLQMLSKAQLVGYYNRYDMSVDEAAGTGIVVATNVDTYKFGRQDADKTVVNGKGIYVLVTGPDGKAVQVAADSATATGSTITASGSALDLRGVHVSDDANHYAIDVNVTADKDGDGIVDYLATGKYTVKVTFVTDYEEKDGKITKMTYKTYTQNFTVTDDIDRVNFVDMRKVTTTKNVADENDIEGIKAVIQECYQFSYDRGNDGKLNELKDSEDDWVEWIDAVDCLVKGDYITIRSITFKIPSGNSGKSYVTVTRNINRAVKLGVEE